MESAPQALGLSIDFYDEDTAAVMLTSSSTDARLQQLAVLMFCLFMSRQIVNLGRGPSQSLRSIFQRLSSIEDLIETKDAVSQQIKLVPQRAQSGKKRFTAELSCSPRFDLEGLTEFDGNNIDLRLREMKEWGIVFSMQPHGFGLLGRGVNYYGPTSVMALLTTLAEKYLEDTAFLHRLTAAASVVSLREELNIKNQPQIAAQCAYTAWVDWSGQ